MTTNTVFDPQAPFAHADLDGIEVSNNSDGENWDIDSIDDPYADGLVPPDLADFDKEGMIGDQMGQAANNSHDRLHFSTLMAALFRPQMDTELEPFKGSNLQKPKQRLALDIALDLFQWEYKAMCRNRLGALAMLQGQAEAVKGNAKESDWGEFEKAVNMARETISINNRIRYISSLPKSGLYVEGAIPFYEQQKMWMDCQRRLTQIEYELAFLPPEARAYFYYFKAWDNIHQTILNTTTKGKALVDFTIVRTQWESKKFQPGQLLSQMPWSYILAYKMHIVSLSEGNTWRNYVTAIFIQNPMTAMRGGGRGGRRGFPFRRSANGENGGGGMMDGDPMNL